MDGQFLAYLNQALISAKEKSYSKAELIEEISGVVDKFYSSDISQLAIDPKIERSENSPINKSLKFATDEDISRLSLLLPWSAASQCSRFLIGGQYNKQKRDKLSPIPDSLVLELDKIINLGNKIVIESGCFEGIHSVSMALCGATVYGFDVRIENVLKSMVRSWTYGQHASTFFDLLNLEISSLSEFYNNCYPDLKVDLYHCRGVLYHLKKPIDYCRQIAELKPKFIYFHTQVASEQQADELIESEFGAYKFFNYREKGRVPPFAGVEDCAKWFTVDSLKSLLKKIGYGEVVFERLKEERNGLRLQILLARS